MQHVSRGPVKIERYNPAWSIAFEILKNELQEMMFSYGEIHHVGSTSIEGLGAKPIIDILITVKDPANAERMVQILPANDFTYVDKYEDEFPFRRYFVRYKEDKHGVHVHVVPHGHEFHINHLLFRDYLQKHSDIRDEYHLLKTRLANKFREDRDLYQEGKREFIEQMTEMAREELGTNYLEDYE